MAYLDGTCSGALNNMGTAKLETRLTVLYEGPFWIGLSERVENGKVNKSIVLNHSYEQEYSPPVDAEVRKEHTNPKRRQKEARRMTA